MWEKLSSILFRKKKQQWRWLWPWCYKLFACLYIQYCCIPFKCSELSNGLQFTHFGDLTRETTHTTQIYAILIRLTCDVNNNYSSLKNMLMAFILSQMNIFSEILKCHSFGRCFSTCSHKFEIIWLENNWMVSVNLKKVKFNLFNEATYFYQYWNFYSVCGSTDWSRCFILRWLFWFSSNCGGQRQHKRSILK